MLPMPRCLNYNYSGNGKTTNPMSRYRGPKECNCVVQGSATLKSRHQVVLTCFQETGPNLWSCAVQGGKVPTKLGEWSFFRADGLSAIWLSQVSW